MSDGALSGPLHREERTYIPSMNAESALRGARAACSAQGQGGGAFSTTPAYLGSDMVH